MKKIFFLSLCIATTLCSGGFAVAQSMPTLNTNMATLNISQPYAQSECKEPNGSIVYNAKQLYLGDSYTTRDFVPVR